MISGRIRDLMNRTVIVMITVILVMTGAVSCAGKQRGASAGGTERKPGIYDIYCLDRDENTLKSYEYESGVNDVATLADDLLEQMSVPHEDVNLREVIRDFGIANIAVTDEKQLILTVDEGYAHLDPTREILTRAAIVRTLSQIDGIDYIQIKLKDEDLTDALGQPVGMMSAADFVDNAGDEINAYENKELTLYFADADGTALVKATRDVEYNTSIPAEKLIVEQLIAGTEAGRLRSTINPQTKIINVTVKDGICYVNLDSAFLSVPDGIKPEVMLYSVVDSLVELPGIQKVQFAVDGESNIALSDTCSLSTVYERNLDIVR